MVWSATPGLQHKAFSVAMAAVVVSACVLRAMQYFGNPSLWFDELAIALNIEQHSLLDLISRPLELHQVAPAGFLAFVKVASMLFGVNEFSLRLFPWISALAAVFLFWLVSRRILSGGGLLAALFLFATSPALVWFSADLKQYSSDVAATLLLVLLALRFVEHPDDRRAAVAAGILGGILMFASHPALTTGAVLGTVLLLHHYRAKGPRPSLAPLLWLGSLWSACALTAGLVALKQLDPQASAYMHRFWAEDFVPAPWQDLSSLLWIPNRLMDTLGFLLLFIARDWPVIRILVFVCTAFACLGLFLLFRRQPWTASLILAPVIAGLTGALLHLFPFQGRVALYAGWPLLIASMAGLQAARQFLRGWARIFGSVFAAAIACVPVALIVAVGGPPFHRQESRPVLATVAARWRPGDRLYVYPGGSYAVSFYGRRFGLTDYVEAACHREDPRAYFREIDQFRGQPRVWFFYTHSALGYREPLVVRSYFSAIGIERDSVPDPFGLRGQSEAAAYLYDLSDSARLSSTNWSAYQFPEPTNGDTRILCDGTRIDPR